MSGPLLQRFVNMLLGKRDDDRDAATSDEDQVIAAPRFEETPMATGPDAPRASDPPEAGRVSIDTELGTWFDGRSSVRTSFARDSLDSNPGTARWFRRPRFVAPGDTLHHPAVSASAPTSEPGRPSHA